MKHVISKETRKERWSRSFRIGSRSFLLGASKEDTGFLLIFEYKVARGEKVHIKRHLFQKLLIGNRIRIMHQSQHQVLKKL